MDSRKTRLAAFNICLWLMLGLFSQFAFAQNQLELQSPASPLECLQTHAGENGMPVYPANELTMKTTASVQVQLTFRAADEAPEAKVLKNSGTDVFADAVEAFVARYRLPCFAKGAPPVSAIQSFSFEPGDGRKVIFSEVTGEATRQIDSACLKTPTGKPSFRDAALSARQSGTVMAEVKFLAANAEPSVRIIYDSRSASLSASVSKYMKGYRYNCALPNDAPITATQTFIFQFDNQERYALKDMDLKRFLRMVVPTDLTNAKFDFNTMACPFDVSVRVRMPHVDNAVGEYGERDPRRKEFVKWVAKLRFQFPANLEPYLFDQQVKVSVPCTSLDL
jgi:hypothetical protein